MDVVGGPGDDPVRLNAFDRQWDDVRADVLDGVDRVGRSGWLVLGEEVLRFERELAAVWGIEQAVGVASGLDALELSLRALHLPPGAPVLTTPLSAFATTLAILRAGGRPVFIDVDRSGQLDLDLATDVLTRRRDIDTLVPVHLYGYALDLEQLQLLRDRFELVVVEDCAQAVGATSRGRAVGSVGQAAATSFYPTKNLAAMGDGGAVLTDDPAIAASVRALRDYGQSAKYRHDLLGMNSRLDELHAAMLRQAFLPRLGRATERRQAIAARYTSEIEHAHVLTPREPDASRSVWHLYPVLVEGDRAGLQAHLERLGIATAIHYPVLIPDQAALSSGDLTETVTPMPNAQRFASQELSLPIHPYLRDDEVDRVIHACNTWRP